MKEPAETVRTFFERMEARDWEGAAELLSPTIHIEFTETGEYFDGPNFLAMNRAYPEGWTIEVVETVGGNIPAGSPAHSPTRVVAQVRVTHGDDTFWCAGFYTVVDGRITDGVEHWVTERLQPPPEWRRRFAT
ncbi:MAG: nuclear transport factor 2 family protein [Acidimicrobiia bacterium]|nr:nuclear transport factor 2 family protein [Acidimicrobiia bacterium]